MERGNFDGQKAEILKKIEEAVREGNSQRIYTYSRMIMDLEKTYSGAMLKSDSRSLVVDFSVS